MKKQLTGFPAPRPSPLLANGSTPILMSTSDVLLPQPSQPLQLFKSYNFRQNHRPLRQILHHDRNAISDGHFRPARTRKHASNQTPEDRLLHMDKHLRRSVLFEHMARETYFCLYSAYTLTTGFSKPAEEKDGLRSISQHLDSTCPTTSETRPLRKLT